MSPISSAALMSIPTGSFTPEVPVTPETPKLHVGPTAEELQAQIALLKAELSAKEAVASTPTPMTLAEAQALVASFEGKRGRRPQPFYEAQALIEASVPPVDKTVLKAQEKAAKAEKKALRAAKTAQKLAARVAAAAQAKAAKADKAAKAADKAVQAATKIATALNLKAVKLTNKAAELTDAAAAPVAAPAV